MNNFSYRAVFAATVFFILLEGALAQSHFTPGVYQIGKNGRMIAVTNEPNYVWTGVWKDATNGLRIRLSTWSGGATTMAFTSVGSVVFSTGGGYVGIPGGKVRKLELRDSNNTVIPLRDSTIIERNPPATIPFKDLPRHNGGLEHHVTFSADGPPFRLNELKLNKLFRIQNAGDYTLTVGVALYQLGTNFCDRIDFPDLSIKVHMKATETEN